MARVIGGLGSSISGKVEGAVFVQFNGGTYVRKAPQYHKNSWTPAQAAARKRFGAINSFLGKFKHTVIPQIWKPAAVKMGGFAYFLKTNMPNFDAQGSLIDPHKLILSTGKLTWPEWIKVQRKEGQPDMIEVSWAEDQVLGGIHLKDELLVISAGEGEYSDILNTGIKRGALKASFPLPELKTPATHLYLFFGSRDHSNYSESRCFEI